MLAGRIIRRGFTDFSVAHGRHQVSRRDNLIPVTVRSASHLARAIISPSYLPKKLLTPAAAKRRAYVACRAEGGEKEGTPTAENKKEGATDDIIDEWDSSDSEDEDEDINEEEREDPFESHHSRMITQEVLLFCFQQDLDCQHTRALNLDEMERAKMLRDRLQTIDSAISEIQEVKSSGGQSGQPQESEKVDFTASFRLRTKLQDAIMEERYEEAAQLRDELRVLQEKLDEASRGQQEVEKRLKERRQLRLGQRVMLKQDGHRGVVCGWDPSCSETKEWQEANGIDKLDSGADQPFYQVLVDLFDSLKSNSRSSLIKYVAQEMLSTPEPEQVWAEKYGEEPFHNPFVNKMFLGLDECGDYLPTSALRSKFSQERRDVFPPPSLREPELSEDELRDLIRQQEKDLQFFDKLAGESPKTPPPSKDPSPDLSDDFAP